MRNGAGYTPAEQQRRERLRIEAAGRFASGDEIGEIARGLRVTEGSVRRWYRAWQDGGTEALRSKGRCRGRGWARSSGPGWSWNCGKARWPTGSPMTSGGRWAGSRR
jgi:hypothetical protein